MQMLKIKDIPALFENNDFTLVFCMFLDGFKQNENKSELISEKPEKQNLNKKQYCMLACAAHKLANDYGIQPPEWVYDESFIMPKPIYAFNTKNKEYQKFLKETSPEEYSSRNLFYGNNVLKRI